MTDWSDPAAWYDVLNPWGPSDDFHLGLVMSAERMLDVGCGTGTLLARARELGHRGRLCGLDPDPAMLARARAVDGVEWVLADAASARWDREFDVAVMASHAFQFLTGDDELRRSLRAIRAALVDGGRFAFETRHPQAAAWRDWHGSSFEARNPDGDVVRVGYTAVPVTVDTVEVAETLRGPWWDGGSHTEVAAMRFLDVDALNEFLDHAGFEVEHQFGDWERGPVTTTSDEVVTIARRRASSHSVRDASGSGPDGGAGADL